MSLFKDGNFLRTYEEQVEHLTKVHRIQLEINKKFKSFFITNGNNFNEINELIIEGDNLLIVDFSPFIYDYIPNAQIGDIYSVTLDKKFKLIGNISGKDGYNGIDGKDGKDGYNGTDGKDGKDGKDGYNGTDGKDGKDGKDGTDLLIYNKFLENYTPSTGSTSSFLTSSFNRTPVAGDKFLAFTKSADGENSFAVFFEITAYQIVSWSAKVLSFINLSRKKVLYKDPAGITLSIGANFPVTLEKGKIYYVKIMQRSSSLNFTGSIIETSFCLNEVGSVGVDTFVLFNIGGNSAGTSEGYFVINENKISSIGVWQGGTSRSHTVGGTSFLLLELGTM